MAKKDPTVIPSEHARNPGAQGDNMTMDEKVWKSAVRVEALKKRRAALNAEIGGERAQMEAIGVNKGAFDQALKLAAMEPEKRDAFTTSLKYVQKILTKGNAAADLFSQADEEARKSPEVANRLAREAEAKKDGKPKGEAPADGGEGGEENEEDEGGEGGEGGTMPEEPETAPPATSKENVSRGDAMIKDVAAKLNQEQEQREGGAILDEMSGRVAG